MPRPSSSRQVVDMYWFAHGGVESQSSDHSLARESTPGPTDTEDECSEGSSPPKPNTSTEELAASKQNADQQDSNGRTTGSSKRLAVEERRRQILEAEQVKNEAILKKHAEREAALEARRNAQRSNISFAFGTSVPPNTEFDIAPVQLPPSTHSPPAKESPNLMTMSMTSSMCNMRGRRKNDLTPTVPYDRTGAPVKSAKGETRKRSVSMSRLDVLAQPRRHYVEAQKAGSTLSSSSASKEVCNSPKRPLSSASDKSNKSGRATSNVTRRPHTSGRKPRPVSIAGSVPDTKPSSARSSTPLRKLAEANKKQDLQNCIASSGDNLRSTALKHSTPTTSRKPVSDKPKATAAATSKAPKPGPKPTPKCSTPKQGTPKTSPRKLTNKKQASMLVATSKESATDSQTAESVKAVVDVLSVPVTDEEESQSTDEKNAAKQHIISEEEAKAALAEKRRLAREQAEKEAALLRQQEEELERERERQRREEEERQRQLEEEQLRLLEEHRQFEEEKLQKAIEEQERKEEEERTRREEEVRLKAEQEKKAKEEAEKQRQELEEKLRKEEEERAERKKRLEKIMSRTRGKSGTASPSGSLNDSEPLDVCENQPLSSEPSSLESNEPVERSSPSESYDVNQALYLASQSLSSNDLMLPSSERTSLDGSLQGFPSEPTSLEPHNETVEESHLEHLSEAQSSETDAASDQDQHSQSLTYSVQELGSSVDNVNLVKVSNEEQVEISDNSIIRVSNIQDARESLPQPNVSDDGLVKKSDEVLDTSNTALDQSAFFQQVESEFENKLAGEVDGAIVGETGVPKVGSSSHAMLAESDDSSFFKQVESGSVNSSESQVEFLASNILHESSGNTCEVLPDSQTAKENECDTGSCIYSGVPGPFQDGGSLTIAKEADSFRTENVLQENQATEKNEFDSGSCIYSEVPDPFQEGESLTIAKEETDGPFLTENVQQMIETTEKDECDKGSCTYSVVPGPFNDGGSLNIAEEKTVSSSRKDESEGNQSQENKCDTVASCMYPGADDSFQDTFNHQKAVVTEETDSSKKTENVLHLNQTEENVCDTGSCLYSGVPGPFRDTVSPTVVKEETDGSDITENLPSHGQEIATEVELLGSTFSSESEKQVKSNECNVLEESTSVQDIEASGGYVWTTDHNESYENMLDPFTKEQFANMNLIQRTENQSASSAQNVEAVANLDVADTEEQSRVQQNELCESMLNSCVDDMTKVGQSTQVEFSSQKHPNDAAIHKVETEIAANYNEETKPEFTDELVTEAAYQVQEIHEFNRQQLHDHSTSLTHSSVAHGDLARDQLGELSQGPPTPSFHYTYRSENIDFGITEQHKVDSVPNFTHEDGVSDQFSISQSMTENMSAGSNNPFGNDCVLKAYCDSMEVPGATKMSETLVDQSSDLGGSYADSFGARVSTYISQNDVNPFTTSADLSTSIHNDMLMGSAANIGISDTSTQTKPNVLEDSFRSNSLPSDASRTQNPFGAVSFDGIEHSLLLPVKGLNSAMDYIVEESEDSSLDSNLSQVLNAHPSDVADPKEVDACAPGLPNGQFLTSRDLHKPDAFCDISTNVLKANGFNGSTYDGRPESVDFEADQLPDESLQVQNLPDHGAVPSRNIFCLDDHLNSTKVAPNPFLGVTEGNPFSTNPF